MLDLLLGYIFWPLVLFERKRSALLPVRGQDLLATRADLDHWRETRGLR